MKAMKYLAAVLAAAGFAVSAAPAKAAPEAAGTGEKTARVAALRLLAAATPGKALQNWMTAGAWKRWNSLYEGMIHKNGDAPLLSDFFSNAIQMTGPQSDVCGISALYNPYQDTILLIQTDNSDRIPRIEDFVFLSGTLFRGEKLGPKEYPEALVPLKSKLDAVLIKNIAAVYSVFERDFPKKSNNFSLAKYRSIKPELAVKEVADNCSLHLLRLLSLFDAEAKSDLLKTGEFSAVLWEGNLQKIKNMFSFADADASAAQLFVKLDKEVRSSLLPCVYFRNKTGMLLGLASRIHPGFVVLISLQPNAKDKPLFAFIPFDPEFVKAAAKIR